MLFGKIAKGGEERKILPKGQVCPCGASLDKNDKFCPVCGRKVVEKTSNTCVKCGAILEPDSMFCAECGAKVEAIQEEPFSTINTCRFCGKELEEGALFCSSCGRKQTYEDDKTVNIGMFNELRAGETYIETKRGHDLSNLKWNYKLSESDLEEYIKSLAPMPEESQLQYRQRLYKEYRENSAILYLIKSEWNIYFEEYCMNCGCELEQYALYCPQCNTRKEVTALTAIFDNNCVTEAFPGQYHAFCQNMELLCTDNGGDVISSHTGVVGCPNCSNYFNYLNPEFVESHLCPHCGTHFEIIAEIYDSPQQSDESYEMWEMDGITRDEWERRMFEEMDRRNEEYVAHWREFWGD